MSLASLILLKWMVDSIHGETELGLDTVSSNLAKVWGILAEEVIAIEGDALSPELRDAIQKEKS